MLRRMDSNELNEWLAYYQIEPFEGDTRYIGHAITAATVANANRGKGKKAKVEEFMPQFRKKAQSIDEQVQFAAMFTAAMGGQDMRGESADG